MVFDRLKKAFESDSALKYFIENDLLDLTDYLTQIDNQRLIDSSDLIYELLAANEHKITRIHVDEVSIKFLFLLLEISQRLGHRSNFLFLYNLVSEKKYTRASRIEAAFLYYEFGNDSEELLNRLVPIHEHLQTAFKEEGDSEYLILNCFVNYYSFLVVYFSEFNPNVIIRFWEIVRRIKESDNESFLHHEVFIEIQNISLSNIKYALTQYFNILKDVQGRYFDYAIPVDDNMSFFEEHTEYCKKVQASVELNVQTFLSISKNLYKNHDTTGVWEVLNRGLHIINDPIQLLGYMFSFGEMHVEKLKSAIDLLDGMSFGDEVEIYDWGCGQAIATICMCDYLKQNNGLHRIKKIQLIEPSEIAVKRAAFNLSNYTQKKHIKVTAKDIGRLSQEDFSSNKRGTKVHLFSNILDVEAFSIKQLISLINASFKGDNVFICTSPKLPSPKNYRFHFFVNEFQKKERFQLLGRISEGAYEWRKDRKWTRDICVFRVVL